MIYNFRLAYQFGFSFYNFIIPYHECNWEIDRIFVINIVIVIQIIFIRIYPIAFQCCFPIGTCHDCYFIQQSLFAYCLKVRKSTPGNQLPLTTSNQGLYFSGEQKLLLRLGLHYLVDWQIWINFWTKTIYDDHLRKNVANVLSVRFSFLFWRQY